MDVVFERMITAVVMLSVLSVFGAIGMDFYLYEENKGVVRSKKSIVATGSMTAFFLADYAVLRMGIGGLPLEKGTLVYILIAVGAVLVAVGAAINIWGRIHLRNNWANHIKIYTHHRLITKGPYGFVRHPLYASIMMMLFGGCLLYRNWLSILLVSGIFIPMMFYRAKQEETLLQEQFEQYNDYKNNVGMFFPKSWRRWNEI